MLHGYIVSLGVDLVLFTMFVGVFTHIWGNSILQ